MIIWTSSKTERWTGGGGTEHRLNTPKTNGCDIFNFGTGDVGETEYDRIWLSSAIIDHEIQLDHGTSGGVSDTLTAPTAYLPPTSFRRNRLTSPSPWLIRLTSCTKIAIWWEQ